METQCKISIRKALSNHPALAQGLKRGSATYQDALKELSVKTSLSESFLDMNIQQIRNWID